MVLGIQQKKIVRRNIFNEKTVGDNRSRNRKKRKFYTLCNNLKKRWSWSAVSYFFVFFAGRYFLKSGWLKFSTFLTKGL